MTDSETEFERRWQRLAAAARRAETPAETVSPETVERILARRPRPRARQPLAIGWFPPGLAAAALLVLGLQFSLGQDPLDTVGQAGDFLRQLPTALPRAPVFAPPVSVPRADHAISWATALLATELIPSVPVPSQESLP